MSYGSYESEQYVEVITGDHSVEVGFVLTLNCVTRGDPGQLSGPAERCYPPEGAEFELDTIHVIAEDGKHILLTEEIYSAIVGQNIAEQHRDDAQTEAEESGDF